MYVLQCWPHSAADSKIHSATYILGIGNLESVHCSALILNSRVCTALQVLLQCWSQSTGCHQLPETIQFASQTVQLCRSNLKTHITVFPVESESSR